MTAIYWDGATDYSASAMRAMGMDDGKGEAEEAARLENFGDWLEDQELPPELRLQVED